MSDAITTLFGPDGMSARKEVEVYLADLVRMADATRVTSKEMVTEFGKAAAAQRELMLANGATAEQFETFEQATAKVAAGVKATDAHLTSLAGRAKAGADAFAGFAGTASQMDGSLGSMIGTAASLSQAIAAVGASAKVAAAATGIGALLVVAGAVVAYFDEMDRKAEATAHTMAGLANSLAQVSAQAAGDEFKAKKLQIIAAGQERMDQLRKEISDQGKLREAIRMVREETHLQLQMVNQDQARDREERANAERQKAHDILAANNALAKEAAKTAEQRYAAEARIIELQRKDAIAGGASPRLADAAAEARLAALRQPGEDLRKQLEQETAALGAQAVSEEQKKRDAIEQTAKASLAAVAKMTLASGQREELEQGIDARRRASIAALAREMDAAASQGLKKLGDEAAALRDQHAPMGEVRTKAIEATYAADVADIGKLTITEAQRVTLLNAANEKKKAGTDMLAAELKLIDERARLELDLGASGLDEVSKRHAARLEQIELEKQAAIESGISVNTAEASALQARHALRSSLKEAMMGDLKTLENATISSKSREIAAIGIAARTARRLDLGYKGASNAVDAIKEAGKALGFAASGQFGSAALAGMSSIKHAAAAALAFKEAGGGGAGGGEGGGGGGGGGAAGPRESTRLGAGGERGDALKIEFVYVQKDSEGRETARVRQQLQRLNDRNQPIRLSV